MYTNFVSILSIGSEDIEQKRNSDINKGPYSVANWRNLTLYNPNLDIISVNVCTKFSSILSIGSLDIERKRNYDINQGPKLCCKFAKFAALQSQPRYYKCKCVYKIWLNSVHWFSRY